MNDLFGRPSTADTGERNANDYYETPRWMTRSLLWHQNIFGKVFEPCAGDGAIARALQPEDDLDRRLLQRTVITNDLDPRHRAQMRFDATKSELWDVRLRGHEIDWVITNPPFNVAFPILCHAWPVARVGVAMLLRKTFLEPTKERGPWLAAHPPTRMIGLPRHSFRGDGSDSCAADWYIWLKEPLPSAFSAFVIHHDAKGRS